MRDFEALDRYLAARRAMPFAYGSRANDCVSFYAGAARAMTGKDLMQGRKWSSELGAARVIARLGGFEAAIDAHMTPIAPALARRGDAAGVFCPDHGMMLMLVEGDTLAGPGDTGILRRPRSAMLTAWTFGD
ncbi:MAG: hypothetical protein J7517_09850 [Sphingobium yanoikuyae]|nr:hypothetical protein [Sphingobium yanoikuyae]